MLKERREKRIFERREKLPLFRNKKNKIRTMSRFAIKLFNLYGYV
jgi:hypothetical protein